MNSKFRITRSTHKFNLTFLTYIHNQEKSDFHMKNLIELVRQFNGCYVLEEHEKCRKIMEKAKKELERIDINHRSFLKVKSLVIGSNILMELGQGGVEQAKQLVLQLQGLGSFLEYPEFLARLHLFKILLAYSLPQDESSCTKNQVQKSYKSFSSLRFNSAILESRLWQNSDVLELEVYQYIHIIHRLADKDIEKASFFYKKGLNIAIKLLGKNHALTQLLARVKRMRTATNRLLTLSSQQLSHIKTQSSIDNRKSRKSANRYIYPLKRTHTKNQRVIRSQNKLYPQTCSGSFKISSSNQYKSKQKILENGRRNYNNKIFNSRYNKQKEKQSNPEKNIKKQEDTGQVSVRSKIKQVTNSDIILPQHKQFTEIIEPKNKSSLVQESQIRKPKEKESSCKLI